MSALNQFMINRLENDNIPTDKIPQDKVTFNIIPQYEKLAKSHNMKVWETQKLVMGTNTQKLKSSVCLELNRLAWNKILLGKKMYLISESHLPPFTIWHKL